MSIFESPFLFTVCQIGAEPALKKEMAREFQNFRFAYSKPGFLTFKNLSSPGQRLWDFELSSVFARAYGVSIEKIEGPDLSRIFDRAQELRTYFQIEKKLYLHIWEKDFYSPGEEPLGFCAGDLAKKCAEQMKQSPNYADLFELESLPQAGDWVLDFILLSPVEGWIGFHRHSRYHSVWPGGLIPVEIHPQAPSRAYLKIEEALAWSKAPLNSTDTALEIGSAPGGVSFALLQRGLRVIGIDPGEMSPIVINNPKFQHIQKGVDFLLRKELPKSIQWILLDMNIQPQMALKSLERLLKPTISASGQYPIADSLLGVILTLKLNDWAFADDIPQFIERVRAMGMIRVKAIQLPSHRREILVFGLTPRGLTRKGINQK